MKAKIYSTTDTVAMYKDVARTYGRSANASELARKWGKKPSYIQSVANSLRGYGVDVAKMRKVGIVIRAVDELRGESPELFAKDLAPAQKTVKRGPGRPRKNQ